MIAGAVQPERGDAEEAVDGLVTLGDFEAVAAPGFAGAAPVTERGGGETEVPEGESVVGIARQGGLAGAEHRGVFAAVTQVQGQREQRFGPFGVAQRGLGIQGTSQDMSPARLVALGSDVDAQSPRPGTDGKQRSHSLETLARGC